LAKLDGFGANGVNGVNATLKLKALHKLGRFIRRCGLGFCDARLGRNPIILHQTAHEFFGILLSALADERARHFER